MKTLRRPLAILLALTMLLTMLSACGKSPAQSFFDLFEEVGKVTDRDYDMDIVLTADGTKVKAYLEGSTYESVRQAKLTGSFGVSGITIDIPEILVDDTTIYVNADELSALAELLIGEDLSSVLNASYIEIAAGDAATSGDAVKDLEELLKGTGTKVKEDILSRKDAIVKNNDSSFTLTLDGVALLDLSKIIIKDLSDNRNDYIDTLLDLVPDSETLNKDTLNNLWDTMEDSLDDLDEELSSEDAKELEKMSIEVTIGKNKDSSYSISYVGDTSDFSINISGTIKPVKNVDTFKAPTDTISADELTALANGLYSYGSDDYSWDDDDDGGDVSWPDDSSDTPSYLLDTQRVGNDEAGYINVPSEFIAFQEEGGMSGDVEGFQYSDVTGKTIFTVSAFADTTPETTANLLLGSLENEGAEDPAGAEVTIAGYDAYQVYGYYPDDNTFLVMWVFEAPEQDDLVHYLAIEFDADQYTDVWELSETFSFSDASTEFSFDDDDGSDIDWENYEAEMGSLENLHLSSVSNDISEFTYLSYYDQEITVPVFNNADWDEAYISTSYTMVDVAAENYAWSIDYSSATASWYDLKENLDEDVSFYKELGYDVTPTDLVTSADGKAQACAFYGSIYDSSMVDYTIIVDYGDEYAVIDFTIFDTENVSAQPILDYFGLTDPVPAN